MKYIHIVKRYIILGDVYFKWSVEGQIGLRNVSVL